METAQWKGAVLDLDGVITRTARLHLRAWKETFDALLERRARKAGRPFAPFTVEDYRRSVDGKPRYEGARSFLESRGIGLPAGDPSDAPGFDTVCAVGNAKNERFNRLIHEGGVEVFDSTVAFVRELRASGRKAGVASSSMNCRLILEQTGLIGLFDTVVGGDEARKLGLRGKPQPDIFVAAAGNLGLPPNECLLFEDAIAGVEAGRRGGFGLVVGVARDGGEEALREHGADLVVGDLRELTRQQVDEWFREGSREDTWSLSYFGFDPAAERLREVLTTNGNGWFATRGAFAGARADGEVHYPGTYHAGVYDRLESGVHGRRVAHADLVNCPDWLPVELRIGDAPYLDPLQQQILGYRHSLRLRTAVTSHVLTFRDGEGRITTLSSMRFVSMDDPRLAALRLVVTPYNWSGPLTVRSALDGTVVNAGVARYRGLESRHLVPETESAAEGGLLLAVRTAASQLRLVLSARHLPYPEAQPAPVHREASSRPGWVAESLTLQARERVPCGLDKIVTFHTSLPWDAADPEAAASQALGDPARFEELLGRHRRAWEALWERADALVEGDRFAQRVVRLHAYHLLVTASPHNAAIDAGLPARGLHGEAYRGHIFWDELFAFPFYNLHFPEISRALLLYRWRRLKAARRLAREQGLPGAMFPWQSADTGEEETPELHYNPLSGSWGPDLSRRQRHVSLAVAYNVWEYVYVTWDLEFLHRYGAELMVEIARFWAALAAFDPADGRFHLRGVMGPDEFHEKYPGAEEGGLDDNSYTNLLTAWILHKTAETVEHLPGEVLRHLREKIGFQPEEMERWREIGRKLKVELTPEGILLPFAGYGRLEELDWAGYRRKYGDIGRLDRILKAEGDSPDRYQAGKQADALMIFYLLSPGQVKKVLENLGYEVGDAGELMRRNYEYHVHRTTHGSTLSWLVHAAILKYLEAHRGDMERWFHTALRSDLEDIQGGTTPEGIHTGVMGGTLDLLVRTFAGINLFKDGLHLAPCLPPHWRRLSFRLLHRGRWLRVEIEPKRVRAELLADPAGGRPEPVRLALAGREHLLEAGVVLTLDHDGEPCYPART